MSESGDNEVSGVWNWGVSEMWEWGKSWLRKWWVSGKRVDGVSGERIEWVSGESGASERWESEVGGVVGVSARLGR